MDFSEWLHGFVKIRIKKKSYMYLWDVDPMYAYVYCIKTSKTKK